MDPLNSNKYQNCSTFNEIIESSEEEMGSTIEAKVTTTADRSFLPIPVKELETTLSEKYTSINKKRESIPSNKILNASTNKALLFSQMKIWKKTTCPKDREKWIIQASKTLENYLKGKAKLENKKNTFYNLAQEIYDYALSIIESDCFSSFFYLKLLLATDLKHQDLIDKDCKLELFIEILHNMKACMATQEEIKPDSSKPLVEEMKNFMANNPALEQIIGTEEVTDFKEWLDEEWEPEELAHDEKDFDIAKILMDLDKIYGETTEFDEQITLAHVLEEDTSAKRYLELTDDQQSKKRKL